ncbi:MAG: hypothetical protein JXO22_12415 [Phycisphaerae bacterium]|nr:hypothetical protein [Phycisphaerae bacterium]
MPRVLIALLLTALAANAAPSEYFTIEVVDDDTGRGVPLVELRTTCNARCPTDSNGLVAFNEPGLMGQEVFFQVASHGYEYPADGFGYRGKRLKVEPGGSATLRIKRLNLAERLYRVTGAGIYRDSILLGRDAPTAQPVLNALVVGQDSVVNTVYHDRIYWFWGDTSWTAYPLGNFQVTGATSQLPTAGGLSPSAGVNLAYFTRDSGFTKEMAPIPGPGPTWIDGLVTLKDADGTEHLYAAYAKVRQDMSASNRGLLEYNDAEQIFKPIAEWNADNPIIPGGHPFRYTDAGVEYFYYCRPFPIIRVRATRDQMLDVANYECFTCLKPGCTADEPQLDRDDAGTMLWAWKHNAPPLLPPKQEELIKSGAMQPDEARFRLFDVASGKPVMAHGASVYWNEYRQRWIMIACEIFGTSMLGEIWLAEAETPLGPWHYAVKIVTHDRYSFYNPKQHPMFDEDNGRLIYFEGTYTATFSGNDDHTPWYDYNQIMYRLDLSDPRVALPVPVYVVGNTQMRCRFTTHRDDSSAPDTPAFFALDRPIPGCIAVYQRQPEADRYALDFVPFSPGDKLEQPSPLFYALPTDVEDPPPTTTPLYGRMRSTGRSYSIIGRSPHAESADIPIERCRVWKPVATPP